MEEEEEKQTKFLLIRCVCEKERGGVSSAAPGGTKTRERKIKLIFFPLFVSSLRWEKGDDDTRYYFVKRTLFSVKLERMWDGFSFRRNASVKCHYCNPSSKLTFHQTVQIRAATAATLSSAWLPQLKRGKKVRKKIIPQR